MRVYNSLDRKSDLLKSLEKAKDELEVNPTKGDKIEKTLWPEKYIKKYKINNLFRFPLAKGWRLTYTIIGDDNGVVTVLLDVLDHTAYDRLFGYHTS